MYPITGAPRRVLWLSCRGSRAAHANHARIRSGRFVSTWNVWRGVVAITPNTAAMYSLGTASWNRSDIEQTNTRLGLRQRSGWARASGTRRTLPDQCPSRMVPAYGSPAFAKRAAIRSAEQGSPPAQTRGQPGAGGHGGA